MRSLLTDRIFRTHIGTSRATYLRGVAAIGVLTIHYGGFGLRSIFPSESFMGKVLNNFVDLGGQGPTAFFVASGYVLSKVFLENPKKRAFVISRYFRLAPTYILISIFAMNIGDLSNQLSLSLALKSPILRYFL